MHSLCNYPLQKDENLLKTIGYFLVLCYKLLSFLSLAHDSYPHGCSDDYWFRY
jgi:hypothetical protein